MISAPLRCAPLGLRKPTATEAGNLINECSKYQKNFAIKLLNTEQIYGKKRETKWCVCKNEPSAMSLSNAKPEAVTVIHGKVFLADN